MPSKIKIKKQLQTQELNKQEVKMRLKIPKIQSYEKHRNTQKFN